MNTQLDRLPRPRDIRDVKTVGVYRKGGDPNHTARRTENPKGFVDSEEHIFTAVGVEFNDGVYVVKVNGVPRSRGKLKTLKMVVEEVLEGEANARGIIKLR